MFNLLMETTVRISVTYTCLKSVSNFSGVQLPICYYISSWLLNYRVNLPNCRVDLTRRNVVSCALLFL